MPLILYLSFLLALLGVVPASIAQSPSQPLRGPAESIAIPGVENAFLLTPGLLSGGQPTGEASFEALKQLGVKTILSVDGSTPDVALAARHGLRYVHIPVGYDGIRPEKAMEIAQAVTVLPGPVFIHCHHGKHRGAAAAAIACSTVAGWDESQRLQWLQQAGINPEYIGLIRSATGFQPPLKTELIALPQRFVEKASPSRIVDAMVRIDALWDRLRGPNPAAGSDQALLLTEEFRELLRQPDTRGEGSRKADYRALMKAAEGHASRLAESLRLKAAPGSASTRSREDLVKNLGQQCVACHRKYRQ